MRRFHNYDSRGKITMRKYSETMKERMVSKLLSPGAPSAAALSRETGISQPTLSKWVRLYGNVSGMNTKDTKNRSVEEKFRIVSKAEGMSEAELGKYLRKEGLHSTDIEAWKQDFLEGAVSRGKGRPKKDPEIVELQKKEKKLRKELRRKDRALAEASALLILKKKAEAIWGEDEDDES